MSAARRSFARRWLYGAVLVALVGGAWTVQQPAWAQLPLPLPPLLPPPEPPPPEPEPPPSEPPPPQSPPPAAPPAPGPGEPPANTPTTTRVEEDEPDIIPSGDWARRGPEIAIFSDGAALSSDVGGATLSVVFRGTKVSWLGVKCSICGIATASIDGGTETAVDTAGSAAPGTPGLTSEVVFTAANLTDDVHALRITVTGNSSSSGGHVLVDAFDVTDGTAEEEGGSGATDALWLSLLSLFAVAVRVSRQRSSRCRDA